ncbi:MAG: hypothetical protein MdMp014T_1957 [Treponematales bacterium]
MEKFGGKVQTAALAALLAMGALALGLGGCKDAWRILTTGDLYWENDDGDDEEEPEPEPEVQNLINLGDPQASTGAGWSYDEASGVFTISGGAGVEVTGSTPRNRVVVNGTVTVTLSDASITSAAASPFELGSGANVTLKLAGSNSLVCTFNDTNADTSFAGLQVEGASSVTIEGPGSLRAAGGIFAAGIGGGYNGSGGTINITSGTVTANGGEGGAGIGGGRRGAGGTITISGGTVNATTDGTVTPGGIAGGAGIGGGAHGEGGIITISGGTVNATGGPQGAGIGGGSHKSGGTISITGGSVTAEGISLAAGIGGGWSGDGGTISISGGSGRARGHYTPGVGPGNSGSPDSGSFSGPVGSTWGTAGWPEANPYTW